MRGKLLGLMAAGLLTGPLAVHAAPLYWAFTSSGGGFHTSGLLTTNDVLTSGAYTITGLHGTQNGSAITGLKPAGFYGNGCSNCWGLSSDNLLFPTAPWLDGGGFTFTTATNAFNIYYQGGITYDVSLAALQTACPTVASCSPPNPPPSLGTPVSFSAVEVPASQVPEPASLALLGLGLAGLGVCGLTTKRRRG